MMAFSATVTPIPEPETYALMLAGLGLLGIAARRRKPAARENRVANERRVNRRTQ